MLSRRKNNQAKNSPECNKSISDRHNYESTENKEKKKPIIMKGNHLGSKTLCQTNNHHYFQKSK
jgi:hypothetical protein